MRFVGAKAAVEQAAVARITSFILNLDKSKLFVKIKRSKNNEKDTVTRTSVPDEETRAFGFFTYYLVLSFGMYEHTINPMLNSIESRSK